MNNFFWGGVCTGVLWNKWTLSLCSSNLIFPAAEHGRLNRNMRCHADNGWPLSKSHAHRACIPDIQHCHIIRQTYKFVFSEYSSKKIIIMYHIVKNYSKYVLEQVLSRHLKNVIAGLCQLWYLNGHTEGLTYNTCCDPMEWELPCLQQCKYVCNPHVSLTMVWSS
jgi:hypothetical protein